MDIAATNCGLDSETIHAWSANLDVSEASRGGGAVFGWGELLAQDERRRAARFHFDLHRRRYVAARGILRIILSQYVGIPPERLVFNYGPNGKPILLGADLDFNQSHCDSQLLVAVSSAGPLGVDLERVRLVPESMKLAASFFSPLEVRELQMVLSDQYSEAFFKCWTRKEAFVKALGDGLSYRLDRFSVSLDDPARLIEIDGDAAAGAKWSIYSLAPDAGYIAAIVTPQAVAKVMPMSFSALWHIA